jgi:hypothetical protein
VRNIVNSTGDDLEQLRNCQYLFSGFESENCRYSFFVPTGAKDSYDLDHAGLGVELTCELMSGFNNSRVVFGNRVYDSHDIYYGDDCYHSAYLFGCIGLRKKQYCILNKQYSKEEYEKLVPKIVEHMSQSVYEDSRGRKYAFGEYFPTELSPFAYNETVTQEYWPIAKKIAEEKGCRWRDAEAKHYEVTMKPEDVPDHIKDIPDSIVQEVIECAHAGGCNDQCTTAFKVIPQELQFHKKLNLPLPYLCPNCRHYERLRSKNPLKLWHDSCECAGPGSKNEAYQNTGSHFHDGETCPNTFETPYAPSRPEIVYCEQCYQNEVA